MKTQHKSKRKALRRGKQGFTHVLELFICINGGIEKFILRGMYVLSTNGTKWFTTPSTATDFKSGSQIVLQQHQYYDLSSTWCAEHLSVYLLLILLSFYRKFGLGTRCLALFALFRTSTLCMLVKVWSQVTMKETTNHSTLPHELNRNTKHEYILKVLKVAHEQFTLEWQWNTTYR